jgi:heme exporter protein D
MGTHASFIAGAYGVTALIVAFLIIRAAISYGTQKKALGELEARGAGRRRRNG